MTSPSPRARLDGFIDRYNPQIGSLARRVLRKMRARLPGALELVYDNYNGLVIGFGPTERASDAVFSVVLYPRWVNLVFLRGASLPDPQKLLKGGGKVARRIVIEDAAMLDDPGVFSLMATALERMATPLDATVRSRVIIKSVSAKQRPRRPA
jgi:hypothetical protein